MTKTKANGGIHFMYTFLTASSGSTAAAGGSTIIMLVLMIAVFYFLLIRPENKKKKQSVSQWKPTAFHPSFKRAYARITEKSGCFCKFLLKKYDLKMELSQKRRHIS